MNFWKKYDRLIIYYFLFLLFILINYFIILQWEYHGSVLSSDDIIYFYGFTEDPSTSKYMVVMDYANKGSLRENLTSIVKNNWNQKLYMLYEIISGLNEIHGNKLFIVIFMMAIF